LSQINQDQDNRMPLLDHFGLLAPVYERFIQLREPDTICQRLKLPVEGMMLDAGGGTGRVSAALTGLVGKIVVADLSTGMLRQAQQKDSLLAVNSHTETLPFFDRCFERILMVDALHHVCDHQKTADELWRVLKPGGRILIEEPDVRTFAIKLVALAEKLALMRSHFLSPAKIEALFPLAAGNIQTEIDGTNAYVLIDKPA
jgi:ubiquinone/menaquinone biosynthesis C-methylase UbiE